MAHKKSQNRRLTEEEILHFTDYLSVWFARCPFDSEAERRRAWEECDRDQLYGRVASSTSASDFGPGLEGQDGRVHPFPAIWYGDVKPKPKPGFHPVRPPDVGRIEKQVSTEGEDQ